MKCGETDDDDAMGPLNGQNGDGRYGDTLSPFSTMRSRRSVGDVGASFSKAGTEEDYETGIQVIDENKEFTLVPAESTAAPLTSG